MVPIKTCQTISRFHRIKGPPTVTVKTGRVVEMRRNEISAIPKDRIAHTEMIITATREIIPLSFNPAHGPKDANRLRGQISSEGMIENRSTLRSIGDDLDWIRSEAWSTNPKY